VIHVRKKIAARDYISEKTACQETSPHYNNPLMRTCAICKKKPLTGNSIVRRGLAKKTGGIGKKISGITRRRFYPNLQRVKVLFLNGTVRRINVCVSCLKAGKVKKAPSRRSYTATPAA
jgi:large subunit ribosomal protein L28